jgi:hypothetical protein
MPKFGGHLHQATAASIRGWIPHSALSPAKKVCARVASPPKYSVRLLHFAHCARATRRHKSTMSHPTAFVAGRGRRTRPLVHNQGGESLSR